MTRHRAAFASALAAFRALLRRPMARRIAASTGSNAYAQATTIGIQLLSLPLFLSHWDVATYGQWMIISAVPAYLAMADVGMVTAAGNRMTMLISEGKRQSANEAFQSALVFVVGVCAVALPVLLLVVFLWPTQSVASAQAKLAIAILSTGVVATLIGGLPEAVYRATQRYALGNALSNTTRLLEWLGGLVGLWWSCDFVAVALGALVPRVVCTGAMIWHARRSTPQFTWGVGDASVMEVRRCAGPAVSFMAFPAANALNFQGMTLIAAAVLGPAATVVFNTYRTMARVTVQATATFGTALWPEFSRIFGQKDLTALAALYRRSRWLGAGLAAVASVIVYLAAPPMLKLWSKGQIAFAPDLMLIAMVYAAAAGGWHVSRVLLLSTNEHSGLAWPFLAASAACLPLAWALAGAFGLIGIMAAMLVLEAGMLIFCSHLARRLLTPPVAAAPVNAVA